MPITRANSCKVCRREGVSLCGKEKCAFKKRGYIPGVHGPKYLKSKPRMSSYGVQLREKQKAKRLFNLMEKQFRNLFLRASGAKGNTAETFVQFLELRLDNVVYRLGFAKTRRQARQLVSHRFVTVNGQTVNIPSYQLSVGDVLSLNPTKEKKTFTTELKERVNKQEAPGWLSLDRKTLEGKLTSVPQGDDLRQIFDPRLIVEFYSR